MCDVGLSPAPAMWWCPLRERVPQRCVRSQVELVDTYVNAVCARVHTASTQIVAARNGHFATAALLEAKATHASVHRGC